ncbi:Hypothetical protein A7982_11530 [Minicystis rosea]|nr:Hypothetical protein A7982_11530 [Minicystis rosea]
MLAFVPVVAPLLVALVPVPEPVPAPPAPPSAQRAPSHGVELPTSHAAKTVRAAMPARAPEDFRLMRREAMKRG